MKTFAKRVALQTLVGFVLLAFMVKLDIRKGNYPPHRMLSWPELVHDLPIIALIALGVALLFNGLDFLGKRKQR